MSKAATRLRAQKEKNNKQSIYFSVSMWQDILDEASRLQINASELLRQIVKKHQRCHLVLLSIKKTIRPREEHKQKHIYFSGEDLLYLNDESIRFGISISELLRCLWERHKWSSQNIPNRNYLKLAMKGRAPL